MKVGSHCRFAPFPPPEGPPCGPLWGTPCNAPHLTFPAALPDGAQGPGRRVSATVACGAWGETTGRGLPASATVSCAGRGHNLRRLASWLATLAALLAVLWAWPQQAPGAPRPGSAHPEARADQQAAARPEAVNPAGQPAPTEPADTRAKPLERFAFRQREMGVDFVVVLYAPDEATANAAARAAFDRVHALNDILSDYDPQSELSRLSDTAGSGQAVRVSDPLWHVLTQAQRFSQQSDGAFDVTVGRVVKLWRFARRAKRMPPPDELAAALATKDYRKLVLDPEHRTAKLLVPGTQLDLGGIAKGYAVDEALAVLRRRGLSRAYVDAGGDLALGDPPPGREGWRIGVAPLDEERSKPSEYLLLANCGVATSGDAFQHVTLNGKRYSHIVDPTTGLGLTDRSSITVIAPDGLTADALASAISVLGPKRGLELAEARCGVSAFIVRQEDDRVVTYASKRWAQHRSPETTD